MRCLSLSVGDSLRYWHRLRMKIGSTQCYDRYDNPYIVKGSRYVVEYYNYY